MSLDQVARGVICAHSVTRRSLANREKPPPPRIVEEINGIQYCSCLQDINNGEPCKHIQAVLGCNFVKKQFNSHFEIATSVYIDERVINLSQSILPLNSDKEDGISKMQMTQNILNQCSPLNYHLNL